MEEEEQRSGKVFITYSWIYLIFIGFFLFSALPQESKDSEAASPEVVDRSIDRGGAVTLINDDKASKSHLEGGSTGRTLNQYYSRRQYVGSPPEIPHPVKVHGKDLECLICHTDGGWTDLLKRITPVTPHPEQIGCMQCHLSPVTEALFRPTDWQSLPPPGLGRSYLHGAPPPIPHDLQMRENCTACHVGPGAVAAIRMKHPWRESCRQCHVPDPSVEPFRR
jgi:nitrate reductase (cytochrome), electron transfer subunit